MIIQCYYWSICEKTPDGQVIPISEPGTTIRNIVIRETRWGDGGDDDDGDGDDDWAECNDDDD